jgi:hypothetical protein
MKKYFSILFIFFIALSLNAQTINAINKVTQKILEADSVVLISHNLTRGFGPIIKPDYEKGTNKINLKKWNQIHPPLPLFLINGKVNRKIFVEKINLTDSSKNILTNILSRKKILREVKMMQCDMPRHTIIIYKNSKQSYIDICFGCRKIHTSTDIQFSEADMDDDKWENLQKFFVEEGIKKLYSPF